MFFEMCFKPMKKHFSSLYTIMNSLLHVAELLTQFMTFFFHLNICIKLAEDKMLFSLRFPPQPGRLSEPTVVSLSSCAPRGNVKASFKLRNWQEKSEDAHLFKDIGLTRRPLKHSQPHPQLLTATDKGRGLTEGLCNPRLGETVWP